MFKKQVPNFALVNVCGIGAGLVGGFWNLAIGAVPYAIGSFVMVGVNLGFVLLAAHVYRDQS